MWFIAYIGQGLYHIELRTLHVDEHPSFRYYHRGNMGGPCRYLTLDINAGDVMGLRIDQVLSYPCFHFFVHSFDLVTHVFCICYALDSVETLDRDCADQMGYLDAVTPQP